MRNRIRQILSNAERAFRDPSSEDIARLRDPFDDALSKYVAEAGIGEWADGGQGSIGDEAFFDISSTVRDVASAIELIRAKVKELAPPGRVEIS